VTIGEQAQNVRLDIVDDEVADIVDGARASEIQNRYVRVPMGVSVHFPALDGD